MKARVARFLDDLVDDEIRREGVDAPHRPESAEDDERSDASRPGPKPRS